MSLPLFSSSFFSLVVSYLQFCDSFLCFVHLLFCQHHKKDQSFLDYVALFQWDDECDSACDSLYAFPLLFL